MIASEAEREFQKIPDTVLYLIYIQIFLFLYQIR